MEVKVSRLTSYIASIFKTDPIMMNIGVIGEISNLKYHGSGSIFFTLKDDRASIRCQMWQRYASGLRYRLEDGMEVTARGRVSVYEKGGSYSLIVEEVSISGEGALMAAYRALYKKLSEEGIFRKEHKAALPFFPEKVCIITSDTGAALRDMMKIIRSRNNLVDILVYPVLVQGPDAAGEISAAVRDVNARFRDVDVIIAGRGGGSLEDLWAFNEEEVARAIYESDIPVISAVGHETDFTIADFAADVRAETPTAAAVLAVPDIGSLREKLHELFEYGIRDRLAYMYHEKERALERCAPEQMILSLKNRYYLKAESLRRCEPAVLGQSVLSRIEKNGSGLENLGRELQRSAHDRLKEKAEKLEKMRIVIEAADPDRIVRRGYAIVTDSEGEAVTDTGQISRGEMISIRLRDGRILSEVRDIMENTDGR